MSRVQYTVFFEPGDVLLFRDHRPFDLGTHTVARGRFPPSSTFYGAMRTALALAKDPHYFSRHRTAKAVAEHLAAVDPAIRGPVLAKLRQGGRWHADRAVTPLLPMPKDLDPSDGVRTLLRAPATARFLGRAALLCEGAACEGAASTAAIPLRRGQAEKRADPQLLTSAGLSVWRQTGDPRLPERSTVPQRSVYVEEPRVGLARHRDRLAHIDGMLYTAVFTRLATGYGYAVELSVPDTPEARAWVIKLDGSHVRLGGKARTARMHVLPGALLPESWGQITGTRARLTLLTPAKASVIDGDRLKLPHGTAKIISLITDTGALPAGGWDFAKRAPKPLAPMLPAGTVFFCELDPSTPIRSVGDAPDLRAGYGVVACGDW